MTDTDENKDAQQDDAQQGPPDAPDDVQDVQDEDVPPVRASQRIDEKGDYLGTYPDNDIDGPTYRGI